jgi:hypothetical protein
LEQALLLVLVGLGQTGNHLELLMLAAAVAVDLLHMDTLVAQVVLAAAVLVVPQIVQMEQQVQLTEVAVVAVMLVVVLVLVVQAALALSLFVTQVEHNAAQVAQ